VHQVTDEFSSPYLGPGVVKTAQGMALNFYPIFIPLNHLKKRNLDFGLQISDLLYRYALSLFIKLIRRRRTLNPKSQF
jgi:hypothetical protein